MVDVARRREMAEFLRSRRGRLRPDDVGMPPGLRRRTPGLRREEVAQLSGVSVTWYTWLEQGRDIQVSRQILDSLARALQMDQAERRHLYGLADQPVADLEPAGEVSPALRRMVDVLDPHPAYLINPCWDLLAWNRAEAGLIGDPALRPPQERNILWIVFTEPALRRLLVAWPEQARHLLAQYRADVAPYAGDPRIAARTEALREASREFRCWWDDHGVADFRSTRREFDHPGVGRLSFDYVKLAAVDTPSVNLFSCMPSDDATACKLPALVQGASLPNGRERVTPRVPSLHALPSPERPAARSSRRPAATAPAAAPSDSIAT